MTLNDNLSIDGQEATERSVSVAILEIISGPKGGDRVAPNEDFGILIEEKPKSKRPAMYKVLMLNDDYTPMDFVVYVLQRYFRLTIEEATQVMLNVHQKGVGVCGVFTYEVAETKVTQVMDFAREHQHPLQCVLEEE